MNQEPTEKERFQVILEDISSKMGLVMEGLQNNREQLGKEIRETREELKQEIRDVKKAVASISQTTLTDHKQRIEQLEAAQ